MRNWIFNEKFKLGLDLIYKDLIGLFKAYLFDRWLKNMRDRWAFFFVITCTDESLTIIVMTA